MDRERITISIKKEILNLVDKTIDKINIRNRSHAIESLLLKGFSRSDEKNAVILLGGRDALKRLPKADEILKKLQENGFSKVFIATGFLRDKIEAKLGDGSKYNLELVYLTEGEGTAGALLPLQKVFKNCFLVFNNPTSLPDLEEMIEFHKNHAAIATLKIDNSDTSEGVYVFEPLVFKVIPKGFSMLEEEVFPKLAKKGSVVGYLPF